MGSEAALDNNPVPTPQPDTLGRRKLDAREGRVLLGVICSTVGTTFKTADLMQSFYWPERETEATEVCGQRSKEMAQAAMWVAGWPQPMDRKMARAKESRVMGLHPGKIAVTTCRTYSNSLKSLGCGESFPGEITGLFTDQRGVILSARILEYQLQRGHLY